MVTWICPWGPSEDLSLGSHPLHSSSLYSNLRCIPEKELVTITEYAERREERVHFLSSDALSSHGAKQQDHLNMKLSRFFSLPNVSSSVENLEDVNGKCFNLKFIFSNRQCL